MKSKVLPTTSHLNRFHDSNSPSSVFGSILRKYIFVLIGWSALVAGSLAWNIQQDASETLSMAIATARSSISKDISFRRWVASHGGVYVPPTDVTPPNPYLKVPERDVVTTTGKMLTLMNPAYALRELQGKFRDDSGIQGHITSLKLLNPNNVADVWETISLMSFEQGNQEAKEVVQKNGQTHLRLMKPLKVEEDCLKCHAQQGYKLGDIRGGISADVPLSIYQADEQKRDTTQELSHGFIWLIGLFGLSVYYRRERIFDNERNQMEEQVRHLAFHDTLTKLPNRRLLIDRLTQNIAASKRSGCYGALMFIDLDKFKPLNDTHGHVAGDLLLVEVANRIKDCVREMDTVARFGGDEFVVMLSDLDKDKSESIAQARTVANKILSSLSAPHRLTVQHLGKTVTTVDHLCTASIGVVVYINHEGSIDDILKWADGAMYQSKKAGCNQICFYDSES